MKAEEIRNALSKTYLEPEWYLGFEVGNSCGCECTRHADAIAMNAYPSRSFETRGFEIKVSRSDLQHELSQPAKADAIYGFTNLWFLVVPKGLTKDMLIPETWGIIEFDGEKLRQKKKAIYHESIINKGFMLAFIRGRQRADGDFQQQKRKEMRESIIRELDYQSGSYKRDFEELNEKVRKLKEATGFEIKRYLNDERATKTLQLAVALEGHDYDRISANIDYNLKELMEASNKLKNAYQILSELTGKE